MSSNSSSHLRIVTITGNPRPDSRTHSAVATLAASLADALPATVIADIDLSQWQAGPLSAIPDAIAHAHEAVLNADILVVGTPVYKGAYTGLLKGFLDVLPSGTLRHAVAIPVTISAAPGHRLLAEQALRPVLAELGASLPVPGLPLEEGQLEHLGDWVRDWIGRHTGLVAAVAHSFAVVPVGAS
jgi:FMN reductase